MASLESHATCSAHVKPLSPDHPAARLVAASRPVEPIVNTSGRPRAMLTAIFSHAADNSGLKADWEGKTRLR
jgi:hypothetical protein